MPPIDALIGHTGFVGSNLARERAFGAFFNSANIGEVAGRAFGTVVCAGVSAVKWLANREPERDAAAIEALTSPLATMRCARFVLVSTVDVYPVPVGVTEEDVPDAALAEPYGRHRRALEEWVMARFPCHHILRLPALFGPGLKKNALFDLMHGHMCDRINPDAAFQWYPLTRFAADLARVLDAGPAVLNITAEPIAMRVIRDRFFPGLAIGAPALPAPRYDVRTRHAALLGGRGPYHLDASQVLEEMGRFIGGARR